MRWKKREPKDLSKWHPWFAWRPVMTGDEYWAWLERIERQMVYHCYGTDTFYRLRQKPIRIAETLMSALREK